MIPVRDSEEDRAQEATLALLRRFRIAIEKRIPTVSDERLRNSLRRVLASISREVNRLSGDDQRLAYMREYMRKKRREKKVGGDHL